MLNKKKMQTIIFILLLLLVGGQLFYNEKVTVLHEQIALLQEEEQRLQQETFEIKPYLSKKDSLSNKILSEKEKLDGLTAIIPSGADTSVHINYFYELSKKYKVKGHTATFAIDESDKSPIPSFYIDVVYEGKQSQLIKVVKEMQSFKEMPYAITDFTLNPISKGEYILKLKVKTIFSK